MGYDLLAPLIEKVSGQTFSRFVEERIFRPAGMVDTFAFDENRRSKSRRALGYAADEADWVLDDESPLNLIHGSGSIYSTVEDLARYDKALFGGRLLEPATRDLLFQTGRLRNGRTIDYGFGWYVENDEETGEPIYSHSGSWMGFTSYYLRAPRRKLSVIILSNSSETDTESLAYGTAEIFAR